MASGEKSAGAFPAVPSTLDPQSSYELYELNNKDQSRLRPFADTAPEVTPYLGLRARLSQIWFNRWTVLLLLVLLRVLIGLGSLNEQIGDAKVKALAACTKVEDIGSAMASMPHYLSVGVNSMAADGMETAVHAMVEVLSMILTGVEQLIFFIINMYVGTYACLIAAFIHGTFDLTVGAVEGVTDTFNDNIGKIADGISSDIKGVQDAINSALKSIPLLKGKIPPLDLTGRLNDLKGIQIDDTKFVGGLRELNTSIPTFDQVKNFTEQALSAPFDLVKTKLNDSFASYTFDKTVFPVAEKKGLSFCSDNTFIEDFFNSLYSIAAKAKIAFIVVLVVLAIGAILLMGWLEIRRWRRQQRHAYAFSKHGYDPMDVVYIASRPYTATFGIKLASRFQQGKRQLWVRWASAYATSLPALFVLSLAVAGFFSCACQAILLRSIQQEAPALANQVGDFAGEVVNTLQSVSDDWARSANGVVNNFNDEINTDLFGWVRNATSAVNNTLTTFEKEMDDALTDVFGGTVLENTVKNVVRCLIGIKIDTVEAGLTWVHDHAHVEFPLFKNDTFSQGASDSITGDSELTSFLATPASVTTDEISGAVQHVIDTLRSGIVQEALISTMLLLVYVLVVLIGVVRSMAGMVGRDKTRAEGGQRYVTGDDYAVEDDGYTTGNYHAEPRQEATMRGGNGGAMKFSMFHGGGDTAASDDYEAHAVREEEFEKRDVKGRTGKLRWAASHFRKSSHGQVEDASGGSR
ncbi:plasma membrane fusion protein PRM1 [Coniochaeta sp. 2T2.1]|nr:plasma membrane fusion protein PRM1 [Coniochaeta sp. 2T2.1]